MNLKTWIELIGALGAISASVAAWFAIRQSNKQLKIEQTPYVILDHIVRENNRYGFSIKNIGKGSAISITLSKDNELYKRNAAFFSNDQPHSANMMPQEESHYWMVDGHVLDNLKHVDSFAYLYIFFESQSNNLFITNVKIKRIVKSGGNVGYVVMENKFEDLKRKVGI